MKYEGLQAYRPQTWTKALHRPDAQVLVTRNLQLVLSPQLEDNHLQPCRAIGAALNLF